LGGAGGKVDGICIGPSLGGDGACGRGGRGGRGGCGGGLISCPLCMVLSGQSRLAEVHF